MNLRDFKHRAGLVAEEWLDRVVAAVQNEHAVTMQRQLLVAELEERILMSAAPVAVIAVEAQPLDPGTSQAVTTLTGSHNAEQATDAPINASILAQLDELLAEVDAALATDARVVIDESTTSQADVVVHNTREVVFVDPSVEGFAQVVDELLQASTDQQVLDVVLLDASRNGLAQITAALSERQDVHALHIVSQGSDRDFKVGSTWLSLTNLSQYRHVMEGWSNAFAAHAELRLYGCDLEQSSPGRALIGELETATGADVVVSTSVAAETIRPRESLGPTMFVETIGDSEWANSVLSAPTAVAAVDGTRSNSQQAAVLVVVDPHVEDADTLLRGIHANAGANTTLEVLVLDPSRDGLEQVTERLGQTASEVGALHFVTHGTDRAFRLGTTWIDVAGFEARRDQFAQWSNWLTADADVLFYGCDLAASESGRWLLTEFATLTQTDVAASTNATGAERLGGDWELEFQRGDVQTAVIVDDHTQREWGGLLATFTVTNTNDSGAGSLRQAISDANALNGLDVIQFALSGANYYTINLTSKLPDIAEAVTIDGWSQPGYSTSPIIELNGTDAGSAHGLRLSNSSSGSTIRGLVINRFADDGIRVDSDSNTIVGNYIGTDLTGLQDLGNNGDGLHINGAFNTIGGTTALLRNVIAGNADDGIDISGSGAANNIVIGNLVGLGADGTTALGQGVDGIVVTSGAKNNIIGSTTAGSGNVVSSNVNDGIEVSGAGTSGNQVLGNFVGTDVTGLLNRGNIDDGIQISEGADNNIIGGTTSAHRNVIAANLDDGVQFNGSSTSDNWLLGNYVGLAADGTALGNADNGVEFHSGASNNTVGGTNVGEGNVIAHNADNGVDLDPTAGNGNRISGNSIYLNDDLGIDLNSDGVTLNDVDDSDNGPNQRQNFPELTSVLTSGTEIYVTGSLNSSSGRDFHIELFANDEIVGSDSSGFGQGQTYLGSFMVTTDASGYVSFTQSISVEVPSGHFISATATHIIAGHTSEFAAHVNALPTNSPTITSQGGEPSATIDVPENSTVVTIVTASDSDADNLSYSLSGGADAAQFAIDSSTGVLSFLSAPDFEAPTDADGDNVYEVTVQVSDGTGGSDSQALSVSITDMSSTLAVSTTADSVNGDTSSIEALNANDGGDGISLREAILAANATPGTDTIAFNITAALVNGAHRIAITSDLPTITDSIVIDGTTDADFTTNNTPVIQLDDAGATTYGLILSAHNSTIRGLSVTRFSEAGIDVTGNSNTITGNWFGLNPDGTTNSTQQKHGLLINGSNNMVGGSTAADGNVFVDNWYAGITLNGTGADANQIRGNFIGVRPDGLTIAANPFFSIYSANGAGSNVIGTDGDGTNDATEGNIIVGGTFDLGGATGSDTVIAGNQIGSALVIDGASNVRIGTNSDGISDALEGNIIARGLRFSGVSTNFLVAGNYIGVHRDLTTDLGNTSDGILISANSTGVIGGTAAGAGNVIAFNDGNGIEILGTAAISIQRNVIHSNGGLGIDLGGDGVTENASNDSWSNFPTLSGATFDGSTLNVTGSLSTAHHAALTIDLFVSDNDASGFGEGPIYLGTIDGVSNGTGHFSFNSNFTTSLSAGAKLSATATTSGFTSEFSAQRAVQFQPVLELDADNSSGATDADFANVWTQTQGPVGITDSDATIGDGDSASLSSLTVVITNLADPGFETLAADTTGTNITSAYDSFSGKLLLSGVASVAHYQQVLRTLTYDNTAVLPTLGSRIIQVQGNDGTLASNVAVTMLTLESIIGGASPTLDLDANNSSGATGSDFRTTFTEGGAAVPIVDVDAELIDSDSPNLQSLTVRMTNVLDGLDELLTADTSGTSLSASYDSGTGTLTLSGLDTVANYQQVLRLVRYSNSSATPHNSARLIEFTATDGLNVSNTATATVSIQTVNDAPAITSHSGSDVASISIDENLREVTTITADDVDDSAESISFAISGGADAGQFVIDPNTGALQFAVAPDFELPSDVDGDNVYEVEIQVSDGELTDAQTVLVTINDIASTIVVTTTADIDDTGLGDAYTSEQLNARPGTDQRVSLREALIAANNTPGDDDIAFALMTDDTNYDGAVFTIVLNEALPTITSGGHVKGATQTASSGDTNAGQVGTGGTVGVDGVPLRLFDKPEIQINANGFVGLTIDGEASQVTVSGLAIYNATHGIDILSGSGQDITITEMLIGLHADGSVPVATERSTSHGIFIESGAVASLLHNYIGHVGKSGILAVEPSSTVTVEFNEVFMTGWNSIDHDGLDIDGVNSVVRFNLVTGITTASGLETSGGGSGIELGSTTNPTGNNLIENNTLVGNLSAGLRLRAGADNNTLRKNVVRSNADGIVVHTDGNTLSGNVVMANTDDGFVITGDNNAVTANVIGLELDGTTPAGNLGDGLDISGSNNTVGGTSPSAGNVVVFNAHNGVRIPSGTGNAIWSNVIAHNGGLGIDLETSGPDANDIDDADTGANNRQNSAVITAITSNDDDTVRVVGMLDTTPDRTFRVEFFLNPVGQSDPSGYGEGIALLTTELVTTDANGLATFDITLNFFLADGHEISAVTTDLTTNDSSEFSRSGRVTAHAPSVDRGTFTLDENSPNGTRVGFVIASDIDPDEQLTFALSGGNTNDTFALDATTGEITVANRAALDREAIDSFTLDITVRDRSGRTGTNEVTINLNDVNDVTPTILAEQQFTIAENSNIGVVIGNIIALDPDTVGLLQEWSILSGNVGDAFAVDAAAGVLTVNSSLPLDFETTPTFALTIHVSDGVHRSALQTVIVNLSDVNEAPVLNVPVQQTIEEDGVVVFAPLFGTGITLADRDSPSSDFELTLRATAGRLTLAQTTGLTIKSGADGSNHITVQGSLTAINDALDGLTYHTPSDFFGSDLLAFEVSDLGHGGSFETKTNSASIAVDVLPVNDIPVANDDSFDVAEDSTLVVGVNDHVLGNDVDPDNVFLERAEASGLTTLLVTDPTHGTLNFNADGTLTYIPRPNFHGTDSFRYQVTDGSAMSNIATVMFRIAAVNDPPLGVADSYIGNQLETLKVVTHGVLVNDSDVEGDALTAILVAAPQFGTVTLNADGSFEYTPRGTYSGPDSFTYRAHDGTEGSSNTTVRITVRQTIGTGPGGGVGSTDGGSTDGGGSTPTEGGGSSGGGTTGGGTNSGGDTTTGSPTGPTPGGPTAITPFAPATDTSFDNRFAPNPGDPHTSDANTVGDGPGSIVRIAIAETRFGNTSDQRHSSPREGGLSVMPFSTIWAFDSADSVVQTFEQGTLWQQLNTLQEHMSDSSNEAMLDQLVVGSTAAVGTSLTVGYVIWILRGGSILVGMVSSLPAWTMIDPLPILETANAAGLANAEDDDSLQSILDRARSDIQKAAQPQATS